MGTYLNVGIIQGTGEKMDFESCCDALETNVRRLMRGMNRPDIIVGVEMGIGRYFAGSDDRMSGDTVPGVVTERLGKMAEKHGIYFVPGSMLEKADKNGKEVLYNSAPVFGPDGRLIDVYRKMCPYLPVENMVERGDRYVCFTIEEKNVKVGLMLCHDWCFPEMARNLTLLGAEIILRPAADSEGLYQVVRSIPQTRAFENQCYFISANMCGEWLGEITFGKSIAAAPDGSVIFEAGRVPTRVTLALDMDKVRDARKYGTCHTDHLLRQLKHFDLPMDIYRRLDDAPLYRDMDDSGELPAELRLAQE